MRRIKIAQGIVYRHAGDHLEFLVLKRIPSDGGFWQAITGTIEDGEDELTALKRELLEEAGISEPAHISELLHTYDWATADLEGRDHVFAVEVLPNLDIKIEPAEHDEFMWLILGQAIDKLKYEGNKASMRLVNEYIKALVPKK